MIATQTSEVIFLASALPRTVLGGLRGKLLDPTEGTRVVDGDTNVYRPDGSLLLSLRKRSVPSERWCVAYEPVTRAAGKVDPGRGRKLAVADQKNFHSGTVGYMRGNLTGRTLKGRRDWPDIRDLVLAMSAEFRRVLPDAYKEHCRAVRAVPPERRIPGTPFTTVACNRHSTRHDITARMGCHPDGGNIRGAYGLLSVYGRWTGGLLLFPRYNLAVDLRPHDLLIADSTELHGNSAIQGERLSVVAFAHEGNALAPV